MYRIDVPTNIAVLPTPAALGTEGFWTKGNPGLGQAATVIDQDWVNALQESLIAIITAAGIAHSKTDYTVLLRSIQQIAGVSAFTNLGNLGVTPALNFANRNFRGVANANFTLPNPTNKADGQSGIIQLTQDGTGSRIITYASDWIFPGATRPVLTTAANARDTISYCVGSDLKVMALLNRAFA